MKEENVTTTELRGCVLIEVAIQIGSGSVLHNMIHAFFGKMELKRMREVGSGIYYPARFWLHAGHELAVMAITGRNPNASGSGPACLLGWYPPLRQLHSHFRDFKKWSWSFQEDYYS